MLKRLLFGLLFLATTQVTQCNAWIFDKIENNTDFNLTLELVKDNNKVFIFEIPAKQSFIVREVECPVVDSKTGRPVAYSKRGQCIVDRKILLKNYILIKVDQHYCNKNQREFLMYDGTSLYDGGPAQILVYELSNTHTDLFLPVWNSVVSDSREKHCVLSINEITTRKPTKKDPNGVQINFEFSIK